MIWIKLIGSLFLTASSVAMAFSLYRFQRKRLEVLDGFLSLLQYIKGQVNCFARPIGEILESLPPEIALACNCRGGVDSLDELIEGCRCYLDEEPLRLLRAFSSEFGGSFREEQTRRCDYYIGALGEKRKQLEPAVMAKSRSGGALWICGVLSLLLLLW